MHHDLEEFARQTQASLSEILDLAGRLSSQQLTWRPSPRSWSVGECIDHLNKTLSVYEDALESAIQSAREKGVLGQGPYRYGWISRWMVGQIEPPPKRRFPASKQILPIATLTGAELARESRMRRERLLVQIEKSDGLDLAAARFRSPLFKLLKLELGQGFSILCAHDRRHLWQARQVMANSSFPAA